MDLLSLVTSGVNDSEADGPEEDILGWQDDETHNPDVPAISHRRGLTTFVFVPFEEVCSASCIYIYIYSVVVLSGQVLSLEFGNPQFLYHCKS